MPFESKAQQRLFFATNPKKAREWAKETPNMSDLPEKKHPQTNPERQPLGKVAGDGMFFQKAAQPRGGRFFRDLPGRDDATFHQKMAEAAKDDPSTKPAKPSEPAGASPAVTPGGMDSGGEEAGGGMYGTGQPKKKGAVKCAGAAPSDWDADSGLPTGFHRPAKEQPAPLEAGGERFHSSEARAPSHGAPGAKHGLVEGGSMSLRATSSSQMGKHASPQFLGTSFGIEKSAASAEEYANRASNYIGDRGSEFKKNVGIAARGAAGKADEAVKAITSSPQGSAIAALVLGKMGLGLAGGATRRVGRMFGRKPPVNAAGTVLGGVRKLITGR